MARKYKNGNFLPSSVSVVLPNDSDASQIKIQTFSGNANPNKIGIGMKHFVRMLKYIGGYPVEINIPANDNDHQHKHPPNEISIDSQGQIKVSEISKQNLSNLNQCSHQKIHSKNQDVVSIKTIYETNMFKWAEAGFWYSYTLHAVTIFSVITFLCNIGLEIPYPVKLFTIGPEVTKLFDPSQQRYNGVIYIGTSVLSILKTILIFWNIPAFVSWLNNWSTFQRDFLNCFDVDDNIRNTDNKNFAFTTEKNTRRFLNRILFPLLTFVTVLWFAIGTMFMLPIYTYYVEFVSVACMFVATFSLSCQPIVEDVKVLMILKTQGLAFEQILGGIKDCKVSRGLAISAESVIAWRNLVKQVRDQTNLASGCLKGQEMLSVAEAILSCTIGVSFVLNAVTQHPESIMTLSFIITIMGNLYYGCSNFLRLYFKVLLAENISAAELLVAEEVLQIDGKSEDAATKNELKFLYNEMTLNAVAVNYGNYFSLDKTLLLNVGAQVVTYLIVIMQFQSSK